MASARTTSNFKKTVLQYFKKEGRHTLPWRTTQTPYGVFVSEIMLQQTQVDRVVPKFNLFIKRFPSFETLGASSLAEVYALWEGLGYNRRAKYLRDAARAIVRDHNGSLPKDRAQLQALPGVGPYTAGAIAAFAYGEPEPFVETNIRTAVIHHFGKIHKKISDEYILSILAPLTPRKGREAREWYAALMDYGAHLKREGHALNSKSAHYTKQKAFKGSLREVRGALMRYLKEQPRSTNALVRASGFSKDRVARALWGLQKDGLLKRKGHVFSLSA